MTLMEEVAALQDRLTDAQRARARAEGARDTAQAAADAARQELNRDFGVETIEQAETMLAELRDELAGIADQIRDRLDQIGV